MTSVIEGKGWTWWTTPRKAATRAQSWSRCSSSAGAAEGHFRVSSPTDQVPATTASTWITDQLVGANLTVEEIREQIGGTTLAYLSTDAMVAATRQPKGRLCRACFDGDYPTTGTANKFALENQTHYVSTGRMSVSQPASYGSPEIQTVNAWHEALNNGDVERLVALSHPDVEVGGLKGSAHGDQTLREWVDRANIRLEFGRTFGEADTVVVEQEAVWQSAEPGEVQAVASVFVLSDGLVTSVMRYPDPRVGPARGEPRRVARESPGESCMIWQRVSLRAMRQTLLTAEPLHIRRYVLGQTPSGACTTML